MGRHDYTPEQALRLLIDKLTKADADLARQVQEAVNAGRDMVETEQSRGRGKKKVRTYRRTVPYSAEEALHVALTALKAHFIEQPLFMNSCHDNMAQAALGVADARSSSPVPRKESVRAEASGTEKTLEIELHTETQIISTATVLAQSSLETLQMRRVPDVEIEQQVVNFDRMGTVVDFSEN